MVEKKTKMAKQDLLSHKISSRTSFSRETSIFPVINNSTAKKDNLFLIGKNSRRSGQQDLDRLLKDEELEDFVEDLNVINENVQNKQGREDPEIKNIGKFDHV